jgi:hypothetical protein
MKKIRNKVLAWALTVCMVLALLPMSALAVGGEGELSISGGTVENDDYSVSGTTVNILSGTPMIVSGTTAAERIVVGDGVTANLTFTGVTITATGASPVTVEPGGTLNLTLTGDNTLTAIASENVDKAALSVERTEEKTASLVIGGTGTLTAIGSQNEDSGNSGGIGVNDYDSGEAGAVTITSGTVKAVGRGVGIGGKNADIAVTGGTVTAIGLGYVTNATLGSQYGAGIGGAGCAVTVSGTDTAVNAYGSFNGIGDADYWDKDANAPITVSISGGTVTAWSACTIGAAPDYTIAYSSNYTQSGRIYGIGGTSGTISITGGTVDARGYYYGIGGDGVTNIAISDASVDSFSGNTGGSGGYGIGGELETGAVRSITISGSATVGVWINENKNYGAVIGGGDNSGSTITIKDDAVVPSATVIGSTGYDNETHSGYAGGTIEILGKATVGGTGSYNAVGHIGGSDSSNGEGTGGAGGDITINTTGRVNATTIGGGTGSNGGAGGNITIQNGTVYSDHIGGGDGKNSDGTGTGGAGGSIAISGGQIGDYCGGGDAPRGSTNTYAGTGVNTHYYASAGIGGGGGTSVGGDGGTINISGGTVYANAGLTVYDPTTGSTATNGTGVGGAGIGGGNGASGGTITISGGTVEVSSINVYPYEATTATAAPALIGGGSAGGAGNITISGGHVKTHVYSQNVPIYGDDATVIGQGKGATDAGGWTKITGGSLEIPISTNQTTVARPRPWPVAADGSTPVYPTTFNFYFAEDRPENLNFTEDDEIVSLTFTKKSGGVTYSYNKTGIKPNDYFWLPIEDDVSAWTNSDSHELYNITVSVKKENTVYGFTGVVRYQRNENYVGGVSGSCSLTYTGEVIETLQLTSDWGTGSKTYDGNDHMPAVTVKNTNGVTLTKDTDYTLSITYTPNDGTGTPETVTEMKNAGGYRATATGKTGTAYEGMTATSDQLWINPKHITGDSGVGSFTKQYDGTTDVYNGVTKVTSLTFTVNSDDLYTGDSVTDIVALNPRYETAGVGTGIEIDINSADYTYTQNGQPCNIFNYSIDQPAITGDITVKVIGETNLDASGVTVTKVYDGNTSCNLTRVGGSVTLVDLVGIEVATVAITGVSDFDSEIAGNDRTVTLTIGSLAGANAANYTLAGGATTVEITNARILPADYTYNLTEDQQAQDFTQGGGIAQISLPATATGVNGETVTGDFTLWHDSACTANQATNDSVSALTIGSHNLYVKFIPASSETNYDTTKITTGKVVVLTVMEGDPQEVTFSDAGPIAKTYGDSAFTNAAANATTGGALVYSSSNEAVAAVNSTSGQVTIVGAGTAIITATAAAVEGQYRETSVSYTLSVGKKAVTVTADNKTKTYGTANPELTFTHAPSDLVGSDAVSDLGVTLSCLATTTSPAGTPVAITGTSDSSNYNVTVTQGTLTINKADQSKPTLSISSASAIVGLTAPTLTAAEGSGTGAYGYTSSNTGVATVNATGVITIVGAGTTTFTITKALDSNYNVSPSSDAVTLTVTDKTAITVRDTAATDEALIAHLQNQGDITVGTVARVGVTNNFTVAVTGKSALTEYTSSDEAQGSAKWIGLLIGNLQVNDGTAADMTDIYYKTSAGGTYTRLTSSDGDDATAVGGTASELVLWIKTDVTPSYIIWLATSDSGANETKLTVNFTAYTSPAVDSGGGTSPSDSSPDIASTNNGPTTTISATVTAEADSTGKASAKITGTTVGDLIDDAKTAESGNKNAVIEVKLDTPSTTKDAEIIIPKSAFNRIADETTADLRISTTAGSVTFDAKSIDTISGASSSGDISIQIQSVDTDTLPDGAKQLVGDRPVYDFSVTAGGAQVSDFGGGTASLSIPYALKDGEDANAVVIYYIDDSGNIQTVQGAYNAATGTVDFSVAHFSTYAVGYNKVSFTDVPDSAWYDDAVTFLAAREITSGTTKTTFSPNMTLTRGQFITLLLRAYDIKPDVASADNFSDAGNTYYTGYLAAAKQLGISNGVGDNEFAPEQAITRQEMFTLLYNALKAIDQLPEGNGGKSLGDFTDSTSISSYAQEAMTFLVKAGIVSGSNGQLGPRDTTTRAQMAQILFNLLSKQR